MFQCFPLVSEIHQTNEAGNDELIALTAGWRHVMSHLAGYISNPISLSVLRYNEFM